jgi:hypothetical protein
MNKELTTLIKTLTNLVQLVTLYLLITWTYSGLEFIVRSILG